VYGSAGPELYIGPECTEAWLKRGAKIMNFLTIWENAVTAAFWMLLLFLLLAQERYNLSQKVMKLKRFAI